MRGVRFASWMSVTSLTLCALGASMTLWRRPSVFPLTHPLFWATTGTVLAAWLFVAVALAGAVARREALAFVAGLAPGVLLMVGALTGRFSFTATNGSLFGVPFVVGVAWVVTTWRAYRALPPSRRGVLLAVALGVAPLGVVQVRARVPAPAGTRPLLTDLPPASQPAPPPGVTVSPDGALRLACGAGALTLSPLLVFQDASDDGFWPLARTPTTQKATERPLLEGPLRRAALAVSMLDGGVLVDAATLVPKATASHLSRFTDFTVTGLVQPSAAFAATGPTRLPVLPFDYPKGRPAHFGALTASGDFVIWRAADAEKGPFTELARGPLARAAPLAFTLFDGDTPQCRVTWLDFAAQADVSLSPTAGEGVPVNVVQFGRPAQDEATVLVIVSLAATGIGAGLDTVLHAPGVYRNRVLVEQLTGP
ncbi:MAG: hypothetical protein JNJ54_15335 [Myxococcaceae bacterium]|nr:hypothetical protein [Myxococcaceae bacterium]